MAHFFQMSKKKHQNQTWLFYGVTALWGFSCIFSCLLSDTIFGQGSNVLTASPKTLWKSSFLWIHVKSQAFLLECIFQKSLFWTCLSEERPLRGCEHHVIWGFWSGVRREMETHLWGWLSKQCRHDEGHCSVFHGWTTGRPVHRAYPSPFFIASSPVFLSFSLSLCFRDI